MIHKFKLGLGDNALRVGRDSVVLSVTNQRNNAVAYIDNSPPNPPTSKGWIIILYVAETGDEAPEGDFIGTVMLEDGNYVLHVFQRGKLKEGK